LFHPPGIDIKALVFGFTISTSSSSAGERLSEKINNGKKFCAEDIVDSFLDLLGRIRKVDRPGEIIMVEEVSVLFGARRSMSGDNVAVGKILDTIRKKQIVLIANAPIYQTIDSHMRAMADVLIECQRVLRSKGVVIAKAWKLQTNPHTGVTYRHTFRRENRKVRLFYSRQCDPQIWMQYEKDKDKFIDELYERLMRKAEVQQMKENKELRMPGKDIKFTDRQEEVMECWKQGLVKLQDIGDKLGVTAPTVHGIVTSLKNKGVYKKDFIKNEEITKGIRVLSVNMPMASSLT